VSPRRFREHGPEIGPLRCQICGFESAIDLGLLDGRFCNADAAAEDGPAAGETDPLHGLPLGGHRFAGDRMRGSASEMEVVLTGNQETGSTVISSWSATSPSEMRTTWGVYGTIDFDHGSPGRRRCPRLEAGPRRGPFRVRPGSKGAPRRRVAVLHGPGVHPRRACSNRRTRSWETSQSCSGTSTIESTNHCQYRRPPARTGPNPWQSADLETGNQPPAKLAISRRPN
jgi:hypothetical protein